MSDQMTDTTTLEDFGVTTGDDSEDGAEAEADTDTEAPEPVPESEPDPEPESDTEDDSEYGVNITPYKADDTDANGTTVAEATQYGNDFVLDVDMDNHDENPWQVFDDRLTALRLRTGQKDPEGVAEQATAEHGAPEVVVITDYTDLDGVGCAAMYRYEYGDDAIIFPAAHGYGKDPLSALKKVAKYTPDGIPIYVSDLGPNAGKMGDWLDTLNEITNTNPVYWRDHHDTPQGIRNALNSDEMDGKYVHDPDVCATRIVLREDVQDAAEYLRRFVDLCDARDRYLTHTDEFKESELVSDAAFNFRFHDVAGAAAQYGANVLESEKFGEELEPLSRLKEAKLRWVMDNAFITDIPVPKGTNPEYTDGTTDTHPVADAHELSDDEVRTYRVMWIFGDCYHSEAGRRAYEEHGADIAVIAKPSGKVSFRSPDDLPVCAPLATYFGGGGHPTAASGSPWKTDDGYNGPIAKEVLAEQMGGPLLYEVYEGMVKVLAAESVAELRDEHGT